MKSLTQYLAACAFCGLLGYACGLADSTPPDCVSADVETQNEPWTREECNRCMDTQMVGQGRSPW